MEVENLGHAREALEVAADILLLDNLTLELLREAVALNATRGLCSVTLKNIRCNAEAGVDYISTGALAKDINATELSMRLSKAPFARTTHQCGLTLRIIPINSSVVGRAPHCMLLCIHV